MEAQARWRLMSFVVPGLGAASGLGAWALAAAGSPGAGAAVWALGAAGALLLHLRGRRLPHARSLRELLEQVEAHDDHPQIPLMDELRGLVGRVQAHGSAARDVVRQVQEHATLIAWVIDTLDRAVSGARESLAAMQEAMTRVGQHAGEVLAASGRGVEYLESMGGSTEELFQGAETLNRSVEEATTSVLQIHGALSGVLDSVSLLSEASDRTTAFVSQVGEAMGDIRRRIDQNLSLAQRVEESARRGREVVDQVGAGVKAIRESSVELMKSIQALGRQSHEIEGVIGIITDVAEETNLLSLNAAILAAQAGERGAAFGVVADQIRSLARRTRESTKHVEELIRLIQSNIAAANLALSANLEAVEDGEELGREAVGQLDLIAEAVDQSVGQSREIVRAAQGTDEKAATMVSAAGEVNQNLHSVAGTLTESLREMNRVQELIQTLAALSQSVRSATARHREAGHNTADLMGSFRSEVEGIDRLLASQQATAAALEAALGEVGDSSTSTRESLDGLHGIVKELVTRADGIREEAALLQTASAGEEHEDG
ncbi:MAG: methyl-accepting chemotaxis protein [Thermodesulfobacteriota bacterium]